MLSNVAPELLRLSDPGYNHQHAGALGMDYNMTYAKKCMYLRGPKINKQQKHLLGTAFIILMNLHHNTHQ